MASLCVSLAHAEPLLPLELAVLPGAQGLSLDDGIRT